MKEKEVEAISEELGKVIKKYKLKDCAFCGTTDDGMFTGFAIGNATNHDVFNIALNVGRLWQHFRGLTRDVLNTFEKKNW